MVYEIIIGRSEADRKKFGTKGAILLGKHYVKMGQTTSLSNEIYMDVTKSHVVFICGKRGSGKSYSMGVIAEGMSDLPEEIKQNVAVVMLDTMGVYWSMKYPNKKDEKLLDAWKLEPKALDVQIYTPTGYFKQFKDQGIPTDFPFALKPSELSPYDWALTFGITLNGPLGVLIEKIINTLQEKEEDYDIDAIITAVHADQESEDHVKSGIINRFLSAKTWGIFSEDGTPIDDLVQGGQVTVLDVSCYASTAGAEGLRALVIGLIAKKLFIQRMIARRSEEEKDIKSQMQFLTREETEDKKDEPLIWLILDEAHEFLPKEGKTAASDALITILREGRQPGISLILASQQPGKIHTDVMTQSDIVLSHRLTARVDIDALGQLMQSYMREGLDKQLNYLPREKGAGIIFDDTNERMYPMRIRPRLTWHGGSEPTAMAEAKKIFNF